jgi:hypothetical protein
LKAGAELCWLLECRCINIATTAGGNALVHFLLPGTNMNKSKLLSAAMKKTARNGKRAAEKAMKAAKVAQQKFREAEKSGSVEKWRSRVRVAMQALEVAMVATAAVKGARLGKARPTRRVAKRSR